MRECFYKILSLWRSAAFGRRWRGPHGRIGSGGGGATHDLGPRPGQVCYSSHQRSAGATFVADSAAHSAAVNVHCRVGNATGTSSHVNDGGGVGTASATSASDARQDGVAAAVKVVDVGVGSCLGQISHRLGLDALELKYVHIWSLFVW